MKKILKYSFVLCALALYSCSSAVKQEEKEMIAYGPAKVDVEKAVSVKEVLTQMEKDKAEKEFTFEANIEEVCSNAGCWINVKDANGKNLMVRFKDHFTIPIKTKIGTHAFLHGVAYWDTIPVDLLQHFAEDAGKSEEEIAKIIEPSFELSFEADGITFEKEKVKK